MAGSGQVFAADFCLEKMTPPYDQRSVCGGSESLPPCGEGGGLSNLTPCQELFFTRVPPLLGL